MVDGRTFAARAAVEVGYAESPTNRTKFAAEAGHANGQPWCATFIVAIARRCDIKLPSESAYTPSMAQGFRDARSWNIDRAMPGDVVFFDFPDRVNRIQHVGIVESVNPNGSLITIEGNTSPDQHGSQVNGGGVYRRHRARSYVVGFGRPTFTLGDDDLLPDERDAVLTANHFVKVVWPQFMEQYKQDMAELRMMVGVVKDGSEFYELDPTPVAVTAIRKHLGI